MLEVGCDVLQDFLSGHIPVARYLNTQALEQLPHWNKVPDAQLQAVLLASGIQADSCVLLYSRNPLAAARAAHLMLYAGVRDVRLLDGGMAAWQAAGGALQAGHAPEHVPASTWGAPFPTRPEFLIDLNTVRTWADAPGYALVSIRSQAEFLGQTSGYDYIPQRGEIPGALWGHAGRDGDVQGMQSFHTPEGRMRPASEIADMWAQAGIHPSLRLAFYCGTGWRASLAFFYAWLMAWERIAVFDGGWMEWSTHPELPVALRTL